MSRPTGSSPPSGYWRRPLLLLGAVLLLALTGYVLYDARDNGRSTDHQASRPTVNDTTAATPTAEAVPCMPSVLNVAARTPKPAYQIGQQPDLEIQVTNVGAAPCVANLSDGQIELLVYNGASRVWGSHDCQIQPGDSPATLTPRHSVRRSIRWSGLSSQPHCAGSRQRIGAGNYTLRARFGATNGQAATFSITGTGR